MVYLPMGYLYGSGFTYADAETDPLIQELREEVSLFSDPLAHARWRMLTIDMQTFIAICRVIRFN